LVRKGAIIFGSLFITMGSAPSLILDIVSVMASPSSRSILSLPLPVGRHGKCDGELRAKDLSERLSTTHFIEIPALDRQCGLTERIQFIASVRLIIRSHLACAQGDAQD
jgi:hypothetical protein